MESLTNLIEFVQSFVSSITTFTDAVFAFMSYEITIWGNTVFEVILGAGLSLYLASAIAKWLIGVVT